MQPLHKIVTFNSPGGIRSASVYLDLDCNLFRVMYSNDCQPDAFTRQETAEKAASDFVHEIVEV
jgi:hypothetical protein